MASKDYLFINKDSTSPSLSRNTGTEASLASRVNKHVQQQRFWRSSGPRQSWYRPFVRSNSGSSAPSPTQSDPQPLEESLDVSRRTSLDQRSPRLPKRSASARADSIVARRAPKSPLQAQTELTNDVRSKRDRWPVPRGLTTLFKDPGSAIDAFQTIVMPLTPTLVEVVQRHMAWATSAAVSNFAVHEGVKRVFSAVLQDKMRAAAFLAMATAQQKKTSSITFPSDQGPELYCYQATKMIRGYIEHHRGPPTSSILVDIFRLAGSEWMNGNYDAARIHFAYLAKLWVNFEPHDAADYHVWETCSSEDIFFALDVDEKPQLALNWSPRKLAGPQIPSTESSSRRSSSQDEEKALCTLENVGASQRLISLLHGASSPLTTILGDCVEVLHTIASFQNADFGSAVAGPLWIVKRHMHATLHQLQSIGHATTSIDESVRRSLIIVLFLGSTTPKRRLARTDLDRLARRLKTSLEKNEGLRNSEDPLHTRGAYTEIWQNPGVWLWMYMAGLAATRDSPAPCFLRQWFTRRALLLVVRLFGFPASSDHIRKLLSSYLYLEHAFADSVAMLMVAVACCPGRDAEPLTNGLIWSEQTDSPG